MFWVMVTVFEISVALALGFIVGRITKSAVMNW